LFHEPDLSPYNVYLEPKLLELPTQRVLTIELIGDPGVTAPLAASQLFGVYFNLVNNSEAQWWPLPSIRARWPLPLETPRAQWIGRYALPVARQTILPTAPNDSSPAPVLADWTYGSYGQILHVGPYSEEQPTVARLKQYLATLSKFIIPASHEEVYLLTHGKFLSVDPARWRTLIRYAVK